MSNSSSNSGLVKPIQNVLKFFGALLDAVYHFAESLFNPSTGRYSRGRLTDSGQSRGPRIGTLFPHGSGGNAPNMNVGGCRSCQ